MLLELNANPNKKTTIEGDTPLIVALEEGYSDIVKLLLENGADPTIRNNKGISAYDLALDNRHTQTARLIIEHMNLQRAQQNLAFASSMIPQSNDTPLRHLDYDTLGKIMSRSRPYNHDVQNRMMENDRIAEYLNTIEQYGMGKRSKKHGKKRSSKHSKKHGKKRSKKRSEKRSGKKKSKTKKK